MCGSFQSRTKLGVSVYKDINALSAFKRGTSLENCLPYHPWEAHSWQSYLAQLVHCRLHSHEISEAEHLKHQMPYDQTGTETSARTHD